MKANFFTLLMVSFLLSVFIIPACNSGEIEELTQQNDSLREALSKCQAETDTLESQFDEQVSYFIAVQDSIYSLEDSVRQLTEEIRRTGRASAGQNAMLNRMLQEMNRMLADNTELAHELDSLGINNTSQVDIVKILITSLKDKQNQINSLKGDIANLQNEVQSMKVLNDALTREYDSLEEEYEEIEEAHEAITSKLTVSGVASQLLNSRNKLVKNSRWIDKVKVCFQVDANKQAPPGSRVVYARIVCPNKTVLYDDENNLFTYEGKQIVYTFKKNINYKNTVVPLCAEWLRGDRDKLASGSYMIHFFIDGQKVGMGSFIIAK